MDLGEKLIHEHLHLSRERMKLSLFLILSNRLMIFDSKKETSVVNIFLN